MDYKIHCNAGNLIFDYGIFVAIFFSRANSDNGKMKTKLSKWNLSICIQFDEDFDSESNGGIFDSLALFDGEL